MRIKLELLAPARNCDIGIAAIDCGADAVYIAGPSFGARYSAGNTVGEIGRLCNYAHRFGARVYVVVNTILFDNETEEAFAMMEECASAGCDAFIIQDMAIATQFSGKEGFPPLFASTQCAIRTPQQAKWLSDVGFSRIILERELTLGQIKEIRESADADIEAFVHGALCVCYSGNCYLSEYISGRSANRGECIQACRSLYDLKDSNGQVIAKDKALLSLKDLSLIDRLEDLCKAGVSSFKIEGRLKSISYVKNVVRAYRQALDAVIASNPDKYVQQSYGVVTGGFTPDLNKTFNRGYTTLAIDGIAPGWGSREGTKSTGEKVGTISSATPKGNNMLLKVSLMPGVRISNGDGLCIVTPKGPKGFRADVCDANGIFIKNIGNIPRNTVLYRNYDTAFEKEIDNNMPKRLLRVNAGVSIERDGEWTIRVKASCEDGNVAEYSCRGEFDEAANKEVAHRNICSQIGKTSGIYKFEVSEVVAEELPFIPASVLNSIRRSLAEELDRIDRRPVFGSAGVYRSAPCETGDYRFNVSNAIASDFYKDATGSVPEEAYELSHKGNVELMRTKYCIKRELGMCPKFGGKNPQGFKEPFALYNNGRRLGLTFDCARCEMVVTD